MGLLKSLVNVVLILMGLLGILGISTEIVESGLSAAFWHYFLVLFIAVAGRLLVDRYYPD
jgi:hypothetical protein